jgi:hypothetical protein
MKSLAAAKRKATRRWLFSLPPLGVVLHVPVAVLFLAVLATKVGEVTETVAVIL